MNFKTLHQQEVPLLIANVWDVASAQVAQKLNFQAIGTSSGAIAAMFGFQDGEEITFQELEYVVKRIMDSTSLPLTVDLEAGYSRNTKQIATNICRLHDLGVVGINLEDSIIKNGKRIIVEADRFARMLEGLGRELAQSNCDIFVNVRTDTYLLRHNAPLYETIRRGKMYQNAGAHGLFVPFIEEKEAIEEVISKIKCTLNVMCTPKLPKFSLLKELGVKRISMGNFVF